MKAQSEIVGYLLLFIVGIGLVSTAIMWGIPLIHKKEDAKKLDDVYNFFILLNNEIKNVAKSGEEKTLSFPVDGVIVLYPWNYSGIENNSIVFSFPSKVSTVAVDKGWIPITTANVKDSPYSILGIDQPSVIFVSSSAEGEYYRVSYKLWFRGLYEPDTGKTHKIILVREDRSSNSYSTTSRVISLKRGGTYSKDINGETYMLTEVVIIL